MARKSDPQVQENIDRGTENSKGSASPASGNNNFSDDESSKESDSIKNASATGFGAIGRTDESQTGHNQSADEGNE